MSHYSLVTAIDTKSDRTVSIVITPQDFSHVIVNWHRKDAALAEMKSYAPFKHCERWSDLRPIHFKFLLAKAMDALFATLEDADQGRVTSEQLHEDPSMQSFTYFTIGLMHCISLATGSQVHKMSIYRHRPNTITLEYDCFMGSSYEGFIDVVQDPTGTTSKKNPSFTLVTNNETSEDDDK